MLSKTLIVILMTKRPKEQIGYVPGRMLLSRHQLTLMMITTTKMRIITKMMMRTMMMMRTIDNDDDNRDVRMTLRAKWECKA